MTGRLDTCLETLSIWLSKGVLTLSTIFLVLMALHVTLDVALRYLLGKSFPGTLEVVSFYYMVAVVFLPLAYVELKQEHISVDVLVGRFPVGVQLALYLFAGTLGLIYFGMLCHQSYLDAVQATSRMETAMANFTFYLWPSRWALPIGFAAMCLAIFANMIKALRLRQAL
ncbi:C4-dicarboxylate ABC transporter permease [Litchfieldella qijiaojingensis]|uniref:TRAP transporter small permease protein n=1 Tax=Litchfieldella qijiaojingensis TaxID=980347 RepID=A0ABQ2Z8A1_9GAMM|nr:TRAP transporter small permease [Halomonas qijiaojingensis]GGY05766.1 C4-dicarboxylate ABC transporter permease [Halomonas qijiaojingensis]